MATPLKRQLRDASTQPLISVVVPAYNTSKTIRETLDSIIAQTYKNFEIIVVDDGSPDNVSDVVKSYYSDEVNLIRQDNKGLAGARNTGIKAAKGDYVAFIDSDDIWLPAKLEQQVGQLADQRDLDVIYTNCYFFENGAKTKQWTDVHKQKNGKIVLELINREVMLPVLTTLVKKSSLMEVGMFDESLREVEDYDLWLRLGIKGAKFLGLQEPLALYRINPDGLSRNTLKMAQTQLIVYKKLLSISPNEYHRSISKQVKIFEIEVLNQKRALNIESRSYINAAENTLGMIRYNPRKLLSYLAVSALLAFWPRSITHRLR